MAAFWVGPYAEMRGSRDTNKGTPRQTARAEASDIIHGCRGDVNTWRAIVDWGLRIFDWNKDPIPSKSFDTRIEKKTNSQPSSNPPPCGDRPDLEWEKRSRSQINTKWQRELKSLFEIFSRNE
jgi:hypothetical protein